MNKRKSELLLIAVALMICAVILLYDLFDSPKYNALKASDILWETTTYFQKTESESSAINITGKVNINTADIDELTTLSDIGEKKASAIIEYRRKNGKFRSIDELEYVDGISKKTVEKNADRLTV